MKDLIRKVEENYLFGAIKYNNLLNIYLMPMAWWVLNYSKYNPSYKAKDGGVIFRDNIDNVTDDKIDNFMKSIDVDKVSLDEVRSTLKFVEEEFVAFYFFIDFDNKIFINGVYDIELERYLPDETWKGRYANPLNYVPEEVKVIFE